ncbi:MAG: aldo/keto reductase [Lachnospiraceae bacterium]|nr:aldo/keto reductase [Lachnospiraceae bacterium]
MSKTLKNVTLGSTGIVSPQNAFGALPIQRDDMETSIRILRRAYEGGMIFFDTARAYSDSEEKIGNALSDVRKNIYIATKSQAKDKEELKRQLDTSLKNLKTDYIDIYQFHCAGVVYKPGDGTGMYEFMEDMKRQGVIRHIGITAHKIMVAEEAVKSGLYETLQFPFSYLSGEKEIALVNLCKEKNVGYIAMKGLAGGLINNSKVAFSYISQFDNVLPIWGIQRESELEEWLSFFDEPAAYDEEAKALVEKEKKELAGDFCRGCGYCMPCPQGIEINQCARMSLMIRRAPSKNWLSEKWQKAMLDIEKCIECGACMKKCPYELNTPELLKKNLADYKSILAGETQV